MRPGSCQTPARQARTDVSIRLASLLTCRWSSQILRMHPSKGACLSKAAPALGNLASGRKRNFPFFESALDCHRSRRCRKGTCRRRGNFQPAAGGDLRTRRQVPTPLPLIANPRLANQVESEIVLPAVLTCDNFLWRSGSYWGNGSAMQ